MNSFIIVPTNSLVRVSYLADSLIAVTANLLDGFPMLLTNVTKCEMRRLPDFVAGRLDGKVRLLPWLPRVLWRNGRESGLLPFFASREYNPMTKRGLIYARFSPRPDGATSESIKSQIQRCLGYCSKNGISVNAKKHVIRDKNVSGASTHGRKIKYAVKLCIKYKLALIVTDLDRISRNTLQALLILHKLGKRKVPLIMLDNQIDTNTDTGYLQFTLLACFAEQYRRNVSKNTRRGMQANRCRGWSQSRHAPYGYKFGPTFEVKTVKGVRQRKTLMPDPEEQRIVSIILRLRSVEGKIGKPAARDLNAAGYRRRNGKPWQGQYVTRVLARHDKDAAAGLSFAPEWEGSYRVTTVQAESHPSPDTRQP